MIVGAIYAASLFVLLMAGLLWKVSVRFRRSLVDDRIVES